MRFALTLADLEATSVCELALYATLLARAQEAATSDGLKSAHHTGQEVAQKAYRECLSALREGGRVGCTRLSRSYLLGGA